MPNDLQPVPTDPSSLAAAGLLAGTASPPASAYRNVLRSHWAWCAERHELQPLQAQRHILRSTCVTVGELEIAVVVDDGAQLVDTRVPDSRSGVSLLSAVSIPHDQVVARRDELDTARVHVLFCNGPQCPQTPTLSSP